MGRKTIQPFLSPQAVQSHIPIAERETIQLLHDVLHTSQVNSIMLILSLQN